MKKTISINIGGFSCHMEETAYVILQNYLDLIGEKFSSGSERAEILEDIESRIGEIFFELNASNPGRILVEKDVREVMGILGSPEAFIDGTEGASVENDASQANSSGARSTFSNTSERRLFRDEDDGLVGGVAAGLGHYFNVSPVLIRAIFIFLSFAGGTGILIYAILWLVVPVAKTTADKLQMKGRNVTIENIKEHLNRMKMEFSEKANSVEFKEKIKRTVDRGVRASSAFAKVLSKIMGGIFLTAGVFGLLILIIIFFGDAGLIPIVGSGHVENLYTMITILYPGGMMHPVIYTCIIVASVLPIIGMLVTGVKLLFDIRTTVKPVAITSSVVWMISVGILTITGIELAMHFRSQNEISTKIPVLNDSLAVLYVGVSDDKVFSDHIQMDMVWNYSELIKVDDESIILGFPVLRVVRQTEGGLFEIVVHRLSSGQSIQSATVLAESIAYPLTLEDDRLNLPANFLIPVKDKLRGQCVEVELRVPEGKSVKFDDGVDRICVVMEADEVRYHSDPFFGNTLWTANRHGFSCSGCSNSGTAHSED